jgi:hypothetical protein
MTTAPTWHDEDEFVLTTSTEFQFHWPRQTYSNLSSKDNACKHLVRSRFFGVMSDLSSHLRTLIRRMRQTAMPR